MTSSLPDGPHDPPGFVISTELGKAAFEHGFRIPQATDSGWLSFTSTTAPGTLWLAGASEQGPWYFAISHEGAATEIVYPRAAFAFPKAVATYQCQSLEALYTAIARVYQLSMSLPSVPLAEFDDETRNMPCTTEAERTVIARIGQDIFRRALLEYWNGRCPLTGITDTALLRASHIVAWSDCESDAQRLDVHNGILLSALWDAAFDSGLISFDDEGYVIVSPRLSSEAHVILNVPNRPQLSLLSPVLRGNLRSHRRRHGFPL